MLIVRLKNYEVQFKQKDRKAAEILDESMVNLWALDYEILSEEYKNNKLHVEVYNEANDKIFLMLIGFINGLVDNINIYPGPANTDPKELEKQLLRLKNLIMHD